MYLKKKKNIPRFIWVFCLFFILILILILVMNYKINYQYLEKNYLYFYECSGDLCVTSIKDNQKLLFSSYDCGYEECPEYKKVVSEDYALLSDHDENILYQYKDNRIVSRDYDDYEFIDSNFIIVKKNGVYGIINLNNKEIVKPTYDELGIHNSGYLTGYGVNSIIAKKNQRYGLISYKNGKMIEEFQYTDENLDDLVALIKKS